MEENPVKKNIKMFLIGGSAGSLEVLIETIPKLKEGLSFPIVIILHRKNSNESVLRDLLKEKTKLEIIEIEEKNPIISGNIYLAPPDYHLLIEKNFTFSLDFSEKINYSRPSIDVTFQSATDIYKSELAALLLSGANADGVEGLKAIKNAGGTTIVQNPDDARVAFMPKQAIKSLSIDYVLNKENIADFINNLVL